MLSSRTNNKSRTKRRNSRLLLGGLLLLSLVLYFITLGNDDAFRKTRDTAEGFGAKTLTYLTLPVRGFENLVGEIRGRFNAHSENKKLREEIHQLSDIKARANELEIKLSRLQAMLNVVENTDLRERKIAARSVSEVNGPFANTALINVGAVQGISNGDAVMTADGLYGHVIRAGNNSARVLKLEDLNSRIAVMSKQSQARAILVGNNSRYPQLSYLSSDSDWSDGDEVLTSGDDGLLPTGLPVGKLVMGANGVANVELFVNTSFVDWVWVYPFDPVTKPEDDPVLVIPDSDNAVTDLDTPKESPPSENVSDIPSIENESETETESQAVPSNGDPL